MFTLALMLICLIPDPTLSARLAALDSPRFAVRQRATIEFRESLSYWAILRAERLLVSASPEARRRGFVAIDDYRKSLVPDWRSLPFIDALNREPCTGCDCPAVVYYMACPNPETRGCPFPAYRYATQFYVLDLLRAGWPMLLVRVELSRMHALCREWSRKRGNPY